MVNFSHMIFYVKDVPETVSFYEKAFGIKTKFIHESNQYAELETGSTALAFASDQLGAMNLPNGYIHHNLAQKPLGAEICFTVDDVEAAFKKAVDAGALAIVEPKQKPWGQLVGYVRDPHRILIELASKL